MLRRAGRRPSHGNYYEVGLTKGFLGLLGPGCQLLFRRNVNNFADDNLLLNTPVSLSYRVPSKLDIYGAEGKTRTSLELGAALRVRELLLHGGLGVLSSYGRPLPRAGCDRML